MKINIVKVSCCGANELLNLDETVLFLKNNPNAELGIGISKEKCSIASPRFNWICELQNRLIPTKNTQQLAFHINGRWSIEILKSGEIPLELKHLLKHNKESARIQLNFVGSGFSANNVSPLPMTRLIRKLSKSGLGKFILPYNKDSQEFISSLSQLTSQFDILYDSSFGFGKQAENYYSLFPNQLQGYAGGLSADNIQEEIIKIENVQEKTTSIWVDAEGKLRRNDCNKLDLNKAEAFVRKAISLNYSQTTFYNDKENE